MKPTDWHTHGARPDSCERCKIASLRADIQHRLSDDAMRYEFRWKKNGLKMAQEMAKTQVFGKKNNTVFKKVV